MTIRFPMAALLCLFAASAVAQTACPTGADLARGIRITLADGATEIYRAAGDGVVSVKGVNASGNGYEMELGQGMHLLMYQNTENGVPLPISVVRYDYGIPPSDMPVPTPGKRWHTGVTVSSTDGERDEPQSHSYGALETVTIGACSYDLIPSLIAYDTADSYSENVDYLPDLGFGYLVSSETAGAPGSPNPAVAISVLTK